MQTYLQEIDEYLRQNIIDYSQKIKAIGIAHNLIRVVERLRKERVYTLWILRHG